MAEVLVLEFAARDGQSARWIVVDSNGARLGPPVIGPLSAVRADILMLFQKAR